MIDVISILWNLFGSAAFYECNSKIFSINPRSFKSGKKNPQNVSCLPIKETHHKTSIYLPIKKLKEKLIIRHQSIFPKKNWKNELIIKHQSISHKKTLPQNINLSFHKENLSWNGPLQKKKKKTEPGRQPIYWIGEERWSNVIWIPCLKWVVEVLCNCKRNTTHAFNNFASKLDDNHEYQINYQEAEMKEDLVIDWKINIDRSKCYSYKRVAHSG